MATVNDGAAVWETVNDEALRRVITFTARSVAREHDQDTDDLESEALILAATHPNLLEVADQPNLFRHRLRQHLVKAARTEASWRKRTTPLTLVGLTGEPIERRAQLAVRTDTTDYDAQLVQALLPAVWDSLYCWGLRIENAPDADMPRGASNPATGNTLAAHVADVRAAWDHAPLAREERRAMVLTHGLDLTQQDAAGLLYVVQSSVSRWLKSGVSKLVAYLNGADAVVIPFPRQAAQGQEQAA